MAKNTDYRTMHQNLKNEAKEFIRQPSPVTPVEHNAASILFRLTGCKYENLNSNIQITKAKSAVAHALLCERKKARMKRYDYDFNRHIALHQIGKRLENLNESKCYPHKPNE